MRKISDEERKKINLEMLCYFDQVCRENDIKYSLTGGTLLGAVRHKGFIPWDDDVDVFVPRPEFEKLESLFPDNNRYIWQSRKKVPGYEYVYGRIMDTRTVITEAGGLPSEGKGVFLDVCVIDGLPDNKFLRKLHMKKMKYLYKGRRTVIADKSQANYYEKGLAVKLVKMTLCKFTDLEFWQRLMEKEMKRYPFEKGKYVGNFCSQYGEKEMLHKAGFSSYKEMEFEGHKFMVCRGWKEYLVNIYGDYMQLPPVEKRVANHGTTVYLLDEGEAFDHSKL